MVKVNFDVNVLKLLYFSVGVDVSINCVQFKIENVFVKVELEVCFGNVVKMVDDVFNSIDFNFIIVILGQEVIQIINFIIDFFDGVGEGFGGGVGVGEEDVVGGNVKWLFEGSYKFESNVFFSVNDYIG